MLEAPKKKRFKRVYVIAIAAVLAVAALSLALYALTSAPMGPGPVKIEITTDKTSYVQGEQVHFSVYVNNTQNWRVPKPFTISFQIGNYSSQTVCIDYTNLPPTFPAHSRTFFFSHDWNPQTGSGNNLTFVEPGFYMLTVTLDGSVDYGAPANYTFEIKPTV